MQSEGPTESDRSPPRASAQREVSSSRVVAPITIRPEHLYKATGLLFLLLIFHSNFATISRVLLLVYAAAILGVAFNVLVGLVPSHRRLTSAVLGLAIFAAIGLAFWGALPALARQFRGLISDLPRFEAELNRLSQYLQDTTGLDVELFGEASRQAIASFVDAQLLGTAVGLVGGIFLPLVILIGGLYAVAKPNERLLSPLLHVVPRDRRESFRELISLLGLRLKGWVKGTLMAMILVGTLVSLGLWVLGVPYALLLGVISGLLEIIPLLGPWIAGAIAVGVAVIDEPVKGLWVALLMLVVQQLEGNVITPLVMAKAAEVHPFVTLFALFLFGSLFGLLGLLLAVPLAILVWTIVEVLWVDRAIGSEGEVIEPLVHE